MDRALDIATGKVVDAEELWLLDQAELSRFQCVSCGVDLLPAAFGAETTRKRPYFRLERLGARHAPDCQMAAYKDLVTRARRERIPVEDLRRCDAMPFRAKLGSSETLLGRDNNPSLRRIAAAYCDFPNNRDHPLRINGVAGHTYATVIQRLATKEVVRYGEPSIWFGRAAWRSRPTESNSTYEIPLAEGGSGVRVQRPYRVRVHWFSWTPNARLALMREFEALLQEYLSNRISRQNAPWVFFIGEQDETDASLFHVRDYHQICTRYASIEWMKSQTRDSGLMRSMN